LASRERLAAQGELSPQDDPSVRLRSLIDEHGTLQAHAEAMGLSRSNERTGMCTTAWVVQVGERTICLSYSGRSHAGENLKALLEQRQAGLDKPLVLSDALARPEVEEDARSRCHGLAHGRRQCSDLADVFPVECPVVIAALHQVFDHDDEAREPQRTPAERVADHQAESRPILDELQRWLDQQGEHRLGEPTSALGKAMASRQGHGETLRRVVSVGGAPLDHTLVERAVTRCLRQRNTALCDTTESSASLARVLTSLIATCLYASVHGLASLVALPEHRAAVCADPSAWWPWTSQARLAPPEAPRRPSRAIWARSGSPCHSSMRHSRADKGTRASAVLGHQLKRPCERLFMQSQEPWPSDSKRVRAGPAR
jgi:hypothetical protein